MGHTPHRWVRRAGAVATSAGLVLLATGLLSSPPASATTGSYHGFSWNTSIQLDEVTSVQENANGIAPATSSGKPSEQTIKTIDTAHSNLVPGGTAVFTLQWPVTGTTHSFDIRDVPVVFNAGNTNISAVEGIMAANGQLVPTPGTEPAIKGYDQELPSIQFVVSDDQTLPGTFTYSWAIPSNLGSASGDTLVCNYAKTTGKGSAGKGADRKAGACFVIPPTTLPTTTTTTSSTTTTIKSTTTTVFHPPVQPTMTLPHVTTTTVTTPPTTVTTVAPVVKGSTTTVLPVTTTTLAQMIAGEQQQLPLTGTDNRPLLELAGLSLTLGGLALLASGRRLAS